MDILSKIKKQQGAVVASQAQSDELETCLSALWENDLPLLPDNYIEMLKTADGFIWNGIEFFGTANINADNYVVNDIVSANTDYEERYPKLIGKLFVGKMDNDVFVYDYEAKGYQVVDTTDCEVLQNFSSIEELISSLVRIID